MYTLLGDANLDGTVNAEDFTLFSSHLGQSGMMWDDGDFNYDGTVNAEDFTPLSQNLGQSVVSSANLAGGTIAAQSGKNQSTRQTANPISTTLTPIVTTKTKERKSPHQGR